MMTKFYPGKILFSFLMIAGLHFFSNAQITTVAGRRFYLGDNGTATSAGLFNPYGVAVDASGNVYITTTRDNRLRKVNASTLVITTLAGNGVAGYSGDGGLAASAQLSLNVGLPGVAADKNGNIYVCDYFNNRIRKIDAATQIITTIAGTGTGGYSGDGGPATSAKISGPAGILVDATGNIFFADNNNSAIRRIDALTKVITTYAGNGVAGFGGNGGLATAANLSYPECIAMDATGNLYIADEYNNVIRKVDATTKIITTIGGNNSYGYSGDGGLATAATVGYVVGIAVDAAGNVYIADQTNNRIRKITASTKIITTIAGNGAAGFSGDGGAASAAQVSKPAHLQVDAAGNIYFADLGNGRVREITASTNIINTIAGDGTDGFTGAPDASKAQLQPQAVTMDALGNLFVADGLYYDVRAVNIANSSYAFAGVPNPDPKYASKGYGGNGGIANSALYNAPYGVVADASNNVYIADVFNNVIRKVNYSTKIITNIAGNATAGFSGDGGVATSAQLNNPYGLAIDKSGNIYIADALNNRIRKVAAGSLVITTVAGMGTAGNAGDGGAATSAQISNPRGVAVDATGNIFILDKGNNSVRMVTASTQKISTILSNGHTLNGVATDASGNVFVSDATAGTVIKLAATTYAASVVAGNGTPGYADNATSAALGQLNNPGGLFVSGAYVYVADINNNVVRKFTPATVLSPIANNIISTIDSTATCSGKITLTTLSGSLPTGGSGTYTYSWLQSSDNVFYSAVTGASSQNYSVNAAITQTRYYRRVVSSGTYNDTSNVLVFKINISPAPVISVKGALKICKGVKDTLYTATAYSQYTWSTGETTASIIDTVSRTNILTVTDANGCKGTSAAVTITVNALPATPTITSSPAATASLCPGTAVTLTSSAATTYKWSTGVTTSSISTSTAGNYTVTITDANGCAATSAAKAISYAVVTTPTITTLPATTTGLCPGTTVTLTSSNAAKYSWSNTATTASISAGTAGNYTVTTTDANGCTATSAATTVSYATVVAPTITSSPAVTTGVCPGTTVTLTSSTAGSYVWSNSAATASISTSTAGNYTVTTTDANGCTATSAPTAISYATVTAPIITSSPATTTGLCPGTAVTLTSSSANSYKWSNNATTASISVGAAGSYTVTTVDANGCTATSAAKAVSYTTVVAPTITSSPASSSGLCPGTIVTLTSSAGTKYKWSTGDTTQAITTTAAANYTVTTTSAAGCTATSSSKSVSYFKPTITSSPASTSGLCPGTIVTLTSSAGTKYKWSTGDTTQTITAAIAGNYTVTTTNTAGCTAASSARSVSYTRASITSLPASTSGLCPGTAATLTASAGTAYKWSTGDTTQTITTATAGSYTVTITNAGGCTLTSSAKSVSYARASITSSPASTSGLCPGTAATLTASAGTAYKWSTGDTTQTITTAIAGSYTVTTTNASGCTLTSSAKSVSYTRASITSSPASTSGLCPGTVVTLTASAASAYKWSTGDTTQIITTTTGAGYTVTTTNAAGCTLTSSAKSVSYTCGIPTRVTVTGITGTQAIVAWRKIACAAQYTLQYMVSGASSWTTVTVTDTSYNLTGLTKSTNYVWQVNAVCLVSPLTTGAYSSQGTFKTTSASTLAADATFGGPESLHASTLQQQDWIVVLYPNPVTTTAMLDVSGYSGKTGLVITDMAGKKVWQAEFSGDKQLTIPAEKFAAGMYFITLSNEKGRKVIKLIKQ